MKKFFLVLIVLLMSIQELWSQTYSYETIMNYNPNYYNDSILNRYEFLADSIYKEGTNLYDSCYSMIDLPFLNNPSILNKYKIYHSQYRKFIDSNISLSVFSIRKFNATSLLIYDNGGLDMTLDTINQLVEGLDRKYYKLNCFYNDDSVLTDIDFYSNMGDKYGKNLKSRFIHKPVHSIKISYYPNGKLFCFEEKDNSIVMRKYKFDNDKSKLFYASNIVMLGNQHKILDIDYYKTKIYRVFTRNLHTNKEDGLVLLGPKRFGRYEEIRIDRDYIWIYQEYNPLFVRGNINVQSEFDKNIYFSYFFNIFGKLNSFSIVHYKGNLEQVSYYQIRFGKIKKVEYIVRKYDRKMER